MYLLKQGGMYLSQAEGRPEVQGWPRAQAIVEEPGLFSLFCFAGFTSSHHHHGLCVSHLSGGALDRAKASAWANVCLQRSWPGLGHMALPAARQSGKLSQSYAVSAIVNSK